MEITEITVVKNPRHPSDGYDKIEEQTKQIILSGSQEEKEFLVAVFMKFVSLTPDKEIIIAFLGHLGEMIITELERKRCADIDDEIPLPAEFETYNLEKLIQGGLKWKEDTVIGAVARVLAKKYRSLVK